MTPSLFRDGNLRRDRGKRCSRTRRDAPRRGDLFQPGLRRAAGLAVPASTGADEEEVLVSLGKLTHVGDPLRLGLWRRLLRGETAWTPRDRRLCDMLWVVLYGGKLAASGEAAVRFKRHQAVRAELAELIEVLERLNGVLAPKHELAAAVPLVLHARYLAGELAAAFGVRTKDGELREAYYTGVEAVRDGGREYDLLLVTLQKAAGVKEHLRYQDFALGEKRFHWQSKAATTVKPCGSSSLARGLPRREARHRRGKLGLKSRPKVTEPAVAVFQAGRVVQLNWRSRGAVDRKADDPDWLRAPGLLSTHASRVLP